MKLRRCVGQTMLRINPNVARSNALSRHCAKFHVSSPTQGGRLLLYNGNELKTDRSMCCAIRAPHHLHCTRLHPSPARPTSAIPLHRPIPPNPHRLTPTPIPAHLSVYPRNPPAHPDDHATSMPSQTLNPDLEYFLFLSLALAATPQLPTCVEFERCRC